MEEKGGRTQPGTGRMIPLGRVAALETEAARERAEAALEESERRVRLFFEGAPLPCQLLDGEGRLIWVNRAWLGTLGYSRDEVIGRPFRELVVPEQRHLLREWLARLEAWSEIHGAECEVVRKDGTRVIVTIDGTILRDERGLYTYCVVQDITERAHVDQMRRKSEQRFRSVIERTLDGISLVDEQGLIVEWNPAMEEMTSLRAQEVLGRPLLETIARLSPEEEITPEKQKEIGAAILGTLETGQGSWMNRVYEHVHVFPNGQRKVIQRAYAPVETEEGLLLLMTARDVTEHRQTEDALREHVERLSALNKMTQAVLSAHSLAAIGETALDHLMQLLPCVHTSIIVCDPELQEGTILATRGMAITGTSAGDRIMLDTRWVEAVQRDRVYTIADTRSVPDPSSGLQAALHAGIRSAISVPMIADGILVGSLSLGFAEPHAFADKEIALAREVATPVAVAVHQARLLVKLCAGHERLRALARYLQAAREEERTRIAREVHDQLGQALTALKIDLSWIARHLPEGAEVVHERAASMSTMVDDTIRTVRRIATGLRPGLLDRLGLSPAVEWEARDWSRRTGIEVELMLDEIGTEIDPDAAVALFRVLQELLTNVARHSGATQVRVTLEDAPDAWRLVVEDNGQGITAAQLDDPASLGLIGMHERIRSLAGEIILRGIPEQGTAACVWVPKRGAKEDRS